MSDETQLATAPVPKPLAKAPINANRSGVKFSSMEEMYRFCVAMVNSGQFKDLPTPEVALLKLQAGLELGLTPVWSLCNILVIQGRCTVWGDALLGIVSAHPECEDVIETTKGEFPKDDFTAICEVRRKGRMPVIREFSIGDAKKANLLGKAGPWIQYPKRMLAMRARAFACRDAFADALRGLGVREEMEHVAETKTAQARVVTTKLELPDDEPTHAAIDAHISTDSAAEHVANEAKLPKEEFELQ